MYVFELKKIDLSFSNYKNSRTFAPVIANLAQLVEHAFVMRRSGVRVPKLAPLKIKKLATKEAFRRD